MTELLPCPFCGCEAEIVHAVGEYWVLCTGCKASQETHNLATEAIKAWNTRTPEQAIAATLGKQGYYTDRDDEGTHIMCDRCGEYIGTAEEIATTLGDDGYKQAAAYWKRMYEELLTERIGEECEIVGHYEASTRGEVGRERVKLSCGHIVERHSKYCQECGRKIRKAVER